MGLPGGGLGGFSGGPLLAKLPPLIVEGPLYGFLLTSSLRQLLAQVLEGALCGFSGAPLLAKLPSLIVDGPLYGFLLTSRLRQLLGQVIARALRRFPSTL